MTAGAPDRSDPRTTVARRVRSGPSRRPWALWALAFTLLASVTGALAWSAASPVGASPDEPSHIKYAWAVATGQAFPWSSSEVVGERGKTVTEIEVPNTLLQFPEPACYAMGKDYTSSCGLVSPDGLGTSETTSYMAKYPMFYYSIIGTVMRVGLAVGLSGFHVLILARAASGMLCYAVVAISAWTLSRRYDWHGVALTLTLATVPNAHFLFSSVNPNGFEIAAAMLLTAVVIAMRHDAKHTARIPLGLQMGLLPAVLALGWTRPLSIAWAGLILLTLLIPARGRRPTLMFLSVWISVLLWVLVFFLLGWLVYQATGTKTETSVGDPAEWHALPGWLRATSIVVRFGTLVTMGFGLLGWADTQIPHVALFAWLLIGAIGLTALAVGSRRADLRPRVAGLVLLGSALIVAVESNHAALGWQGRYWLPPVASALVMLIPSLEGRGISAARRRMIWSTGTLTVGVILLASLVFNMWRYRYGFSVPFLRFQEIPFPWREPVWSPPGGTHLFYLLGCAWVLFSFLAYPAIGRAAGIVGPPGRRPGPVVPAATESGVTPTGDTSSGTVRVPCENPVEAASADESSNGGEPC